MEKQKERVPTNYEILEKATVFSVCQRSREEIHGTTIEDLSLLKKMGVEVIIRGIVGAIGPEEATMRTANVKEILDSARSHNILAGGMINSRNIVPSSVPTDKFDSYSAMNAKGEFTQYGVHAREGCLNNPSHRQHVKNIVRALINGGIDTIHYDEAYGHYYNRKKLAGFCDHCISQFAIHLAKRYSCRDLLERFGIDDIREFNYREYLRDRGWSDKPWKSVLHDDWWIFQLKSTYEKEKEILQDAKEYCRKLLRKRFIGSSNQWNLLLNPIVTMESEIYDYVNIGTWGAESKFYPPLHSYVPEYRMARALTPEKPIVMFIDHWDSFKLADDLLKWLYAEAYASGCFFASPYIFSTFRGPINTMKDCGCFFKKCRSFYHDTLQVSNVGVVFSYASQLWDMYPKGWEPEIEKPIHHYQYYGVCRALLDSCIQFDTIFLRDGNILSDNQTVKDLLRFKILVVPWAYSLSDRNIEVLEQYVQAGGTTVVIGDFGKVDEQNVPRKKLPQLVSAETSGTVTNLSIDLAQYMKNGTGEGQKLTRFLLEKLNLKPIIHIDNPARIQVTMRQNGTGFMLDLINRDFQDQKANLQENLSIRFTVPMKLEQFDKELKALTFDSEPIECEVKDDGGYRFKLVVPRLEVYNLIPLGVLGQEE